MTLKNITRILPILFLTAAFYHGCAPKSQKSTLIPLTIAFQDWVGYGLFHLAEEQGFMRDEGVELIFIDEQLDSSRRDALKAGMLDLEAGTLDLLVSKAAQGTPVVAVMEMDQSNGADGIVADGSIKTLADLSGKRVALARDDVGETLVSTFFSQARLSLGSLTIAAKAPEDVAQAFLQGEAAACVTWEPHLSEALKKPGAHLLASTKDRPGIIIDTLNVRRDLLTENPEAVKKVMRGWFRALRYYKAYPLKASEIIAWHYKITPETYRKLVEGLAWEDYESQKAPSEHKEWKDIFDKIATIKLVNGRISQKPDPEKFLDHTLIENLYENRK